MKITKSQKMAIVNEISRRIEKERQEFREKFIKNYKFTKEEKEFIDLCKETEELEKNLENFKEKNRNLAHKFDYPIVYGFVNSCSAKDHILNNRMKEVYSPKSVDFSEIRDRLEFATLDPSFNVEEFIKKYI